MRIHTSKQDSLYRSYWEPMQERLEQNLTEYIRHYLMRNGSVVRQGDVYLAIKQETEQLDSVGIISYLEKLEAYANHYARLLQPGLEQSQRIRERLLRLNRMQVTVAYPFLLNVFADRAEGKLSEDECIETLDVLENFLTRRFICGIPTTGLNRVFPVLYAQAVQSPSLSDGVKEVLRTRNYPRDAEFTDRFVSSQFYGAGDRVDRTKLVLERLEASFGHKESVPVNVLTIEHLMPQTLTDWWRNHLGDQWAVAHETLLNTIGNLTLTAYNSPLSNGDWPHKQELLAESHIELNAYFRDQPVWNEEAIRQRAEVLAKRALHIWPYFGRSFEDISMSESSVTGRTPVAVHIFGQRLPTSSWRDVAQHTLETIADLDPTGFDSISERFPRMISSDPSRMRSSRQLHNGKYLETHLSADAIYRFCVQATQIADMSPDDWSVEFQ